MRLFSRRRIILCVHCTISISVDECAIGNASGKLSLILSSEAQLVTNLGAQTVGADQEIGLIAGLDYTRANPTERRPPLSAKLRTVAPA